MDKKMVYYQYMSDESDYFVENLSKGHIQPYEIENLPNYYQIVTEKKSPWKNYIIPNNRIKEQGWKIHLSATMDNAQEILQVASKIMFKYQITFKHINDKQSLFYVNSKNGDRISSGKFITIYPNSNEIFFQLLNELYVELKNYENGPYILNDKCWKESNIYYRYGAFVKMLNENGELCIKDETGKLTPDNRNPFYMVPKFVEDYDKYLDLNNNLVVDNQANSKFNNYEFQGVLRFNNGGGIYTGIRKSDQKKVVIKEGRPKVGLDGQHNDAIDRLHIEYEALTNLKNVDGIVNVLDYFKTWKHVFLVEEFVEGLTLQSWCAVNYPFNLENNKNLYIEKVKEIINNLINTVKSMHHKGIGMGDIQPFNIMVTPNLKVKLIDFEAALDVETEGKVAMKTLGYTHDKNKNHKERDWYAVKKILRFCILPIGPITDIEENIRFKHDEWIIKEYGRDIYDYMINIEHLCDEYLTFTRERYNLNNVIDIKHNIFDIATIIEKLRNNINNNLLSESSLVHGDVRQFETPNGKLNVFTGGTGAALAFYRSGGINQPIINWIENVLLRNLNSFEEHGLFNGKAGIATTLYELGYKKEALQLFNEISFNNTKDVSLRSGLSGIGLSIISLYLEEKKFEYLELSELIAIEIEKIINENNELFVSDWTAVPVGLIDGLSGVSFFYSALYAVTTKKEYLLRSVDYIERDLKQCKSDEETNTLQTFDHQNLRVLPYLSGGSVGIGIAIWYLNFVNKSNLFTGELEQIIGLNKTRCTFSGGLFEGAGSFLIIPSLLNYNEKEKKHHTELALQRLDLFLIQRDSQILFPGNFCYKLADDYYSGSAGIILGLRSIEIENPIFWLPIINVNTFLEKTNFMKSENNIVV